jgi:hypothetical protein
MAFATIQITQGATVGGSGESVIGFDTSTLITMTDDGGAGATSYLWECISWPAPDAAAPTIGTPTAQVATITPGGGGLTDGVYVLRLTRDDPGDGVSTDVRFFAVEDADGLSLPSPAMNRNMSNVGGSAAAQKAGWSGSTEGATNVLHDAFQRLRRKREGKYQGRGEVVVHSVGTPVTDNYVYDTENPFVDLTLTGAGTYTADLDAAGAEEGAVFRFLLTYNTGAGNFTIKDSGGPNILGLVAPPSGSASYEAICRFDGVDWVLTSVTLVAAQALVRSEEFLGVAGVANNSEGTFARIGTLRIDPSQFPTAQARFEASFETSDAGNDAEVRLYNVTDVAAVAGSTFSTSSTTLVTQGATVTLPGTLKDYEVQLRLSSTDVAERATCTKARVTLTWA